MAERTRLVLLRHGQTDWNHTGRFQGRTDIDLNDTGRRQAHAVARLVAALGPSAIYSSPLLRARHTAEPVAERLGLPITFDDRLQEISVGSWSGLNKDQVAASDPGFAAALARGEDFRRSPEGETADEVGVRMRDALTEIAAANAGTTTLVATHGMALRMGTGYLLGLDFAHSWRLGAMDNCGWTILDQRTDGWYLECYNRSVLQVQPEDVSGEGA